MRLAGDCSSPAITGSALEVQAVYREHKIPWCQGQVSSAYTLNCMSQVWDNSTVSAVQCWGLAQSVEHAAVNRSAVGSNPTFPVSLSATGSPERQGVRQHNVH